MATPDEPVVAFELADTTVAALALAPLVATTGYLPHATAGVVAEVSYHLRWSRPALTFPTEAPGTVRLGLTIEGGARWANGRILSLASFVTFTVMPQPAQDEQGHYARLALATPHLGELRLTYAGVALPPEPVRPALGLPLEADLVPVREALRAEILRFIEVLPDLALSPHFASDWAGQVAISAAASTPALTLSLAPDAVFSNPPPSVVTKRQPAAMLLNSAAFAAAFEVLAVPQLATLLPDSMRMLRLQGTCAQDRVWFAVQARLTVDDAAEAEVTATIEAEPRLSDGRWRLVFDRVAVASTPDNALAAQTLGELLAAEGFHERLMALTQGAILGAITPAMGVGSADLRWQWPFPPSTSAVGLTFAADHLRVVEGFFALEGTLALPTHAEELEDAPEGDLRIAGAPVALDGGLSQQVTVRAVAAHGLTPPLDYAWWQGNGNGLLLEHSPEIAVVLRVAEDDPTYTLPRHLKSRSGPIGRTTLRAAIIDCQGNVAEAITEIDLAELAAGAAEPGTPLVGTAAGPGVSRNLATQHATAMTTRVGTAYQPTVTQVQARSSVLGMVAGGLAVFAILAVVATFFLTHSLAAPGLTAQATHTPAPTQPVATHTAHSPTPTPRPGATSTPGPTATPQPFGRFSVTPDSLQFICTGGTTAPMTLNLANIGQASINWTAKVFGAVSAGTTVQPWAAVAPTAGTLAPGASVTITVTPAASFCQAPSAQSYTLQFAAPNQAVVPSNVMATHN